jgi:hypothetical protein
MTNHPTDFHQPRDHDGHEGPTDTGTALDDSSADAPHSDVEAPAAGGPGPDSREIEDRRTADPVNRWATEHYGFENEPQQEASPTSMSQPHGLVVGLWSRKRALLAAGALGLVLTGGVGGAAIASSANGDGEGGPGGPGGNDQVNADFDGDGRGGGFR